MFRTWKAKPPNTQRVDYRHFQQMPMPNQALPFNPTKYQAWAYVVRGTPRNQKVVTLQLHSNLVMYKVGVLFLKQNLQASVSIKHSGFRQWFIKTTHTHAASVLTQWVDIWKALEETTVRKAGVFKGMQSTKQATVPACLIEQLLVSQNGVKNKQHLKLSSYYFLYTIFCSVLCTRLLSSCSTCHLSTLLKAWGSIFFPRVHCFNKADYDITTAMVSIVLYLYNQHLSIFKYCVCECVRV